MVRVATVIELVDLVDGVFGAEYSTKNRLFSIMMTSQKRIYTKRQVRNLYEMTMAVRHAFSHWGDKKKVLGVLTTTGRLPSTIDTVDKLMMVINYGCSGILDALAAKLLGLCYDPDFAGTNFTVLLANFDTDVRDHMVT